MTARAAGVSKSSSSAAAKGAQAASSCSAGGPREGISERVAAGRGLRHRLLREVDRLAPGRGQEEDQHRLASPLVERLPDRRDVPERLGHLLAGEAEHPVVRPDLRERVAERLRLRDLVLVVREDEVEATAVDLERRAVDLLRHRRALDVPARPAAPPRRVPPGVLGLRLVRLPEREVAAVLLERVRLLLLDLVGPLAGEPPVVGKRRDAEVDVATDGVRVAARDQLLDERGRSAAPTRSPSAGGRACRGRGRRCPRRYHSVARAASSALAPGAAS